MDSWWHLLWRARNGDHAVEMIKSACSKFSCDRVEYYGFDLFEDATKSILEKEFSKGKPPSLSHVKSKLDKTKSRIFLYKGNTRKILPKVINELPVMDFVFIDGGHSINTIKSDWMWVQRVMDKKTIVIFDDYFNIEEAGCKRIIDNLDREKYKIQILLPKDKFKKEWGILEINLVKVKRK